MAQTAVNGFRPGGIVPCNPDTLDGIHLVLSLATRINEKCNPADGVQEENEEAGYAISCKDVQRFVKLFCLVIKFGKEVLFLPQNR